MEIVLLGTGDATGTPKIGCNCKTCRDARIEGWCRTRFSILVKNNGKNILIDTSPDMRLQLLKADVHRVDAVIWTHGHYDHFAGFGDFYRVQNGVKVYSVKEVLQYIGNFLHFIRYRPIEKEAYTPFELFGLKITLFDVNHPPMERSIGLCIENDTKKVVITGDTNIKIPEESLKIMRDADLMIADAIAPEGFNLKKHMNAGEAYRLARSLNARKVIFSHISHFYPPHEEASANYPLGKDMQRFVF